MSAQLFLRLISTSIWPSVYFYTLFVSLSARHLVALRCGKASKCACCDDSSRVLLATRAEITIPHCHTKWRASSRNNRMALHFVLRTEHISRRDRELYLFSLAKYVKLWAKCLDYCKYFVHPFYSRRMLDLKRWRHTYIQIMTIMQ